MIGAGIFALALVAIGYLLKGWSIGLIGAAAFLALVLPANYAVIFLMARFDRINPIVAFQAVKWASAAIVLAGMVIAVR